MRNLTFFTIFLACLTFELALPHAMLQAAKSNLYDQNKTIRNEKKQRDVNRNARKAEKEEKSFWTSKSLTTDEDNKKTEEGT